VQWKAEHCSCPKGDNGNSATCRIHGVATEDDGKIHHLALSAYRKAVTEARARDEAPLVALVNAVPVGLDPIGWRAAVLAYMERRGMILDPQRAPAVVAGLVRGGQDDVAAAYKRALAPRNKVAPERRGATWKTRGPMLPVDDGRDE
jgi:hypothetical protein